MSESVRFCKQIPRGIYDRFVNYAQSSGMDEREAFIALVNQFTKRLDEKPELPKPAAQEQQQPKPQNSLTTEEKVELSWLEKQPFQNLDGSEIDRLNFLTMKKRQSQQT